ncbi:Long-chain acyl-CoA synthetase (AMP-forming) [Thalassolituus maritimus]|uniref:Long-chain acyl-CoA synthetase (AMP-forming) n=1 Tax=Thalassolituus maritimus TaxID=484498 RepID=A0A1N7Q9E8_9GAMM|nr:AMP-binding protein [Thalassolituus maritimus]SIT19465.1 Long-chain acyl-CoA synthetase (AMP-forming) [Thalassolituus maritimus]
MNADYVNNIIPRLSSSSVKLHFFENGEHVVYDAKAIKRDIARTIELFQKHGLKPGMRIGIVGANSYEWVIVDLACLAYGLLSAGMDAAAGHDIDRIVSECDIDFVYYLDKDEQLNKHFDKSASHDEVELSIDPHRYDGKEAIGLKFTSGSTGHVKAMMLRSTSVSDTLTNVQAMFNHQPGDNILIFLPLYLFQQRFWIYSGILFDHDVIVVPYRFAITAMQRLNPSVVMGVPEFFERLVQDIDAHDEQCKLAFNSLLGNNIRYLWSGSAPLSEDALDKYKQLGIPLYQGYGMNETCIIAKNYPGNNRVGSVGKVVPSKSVLLEGSGQILVRSKHAVTDGYLNVSEEEGRQVFREDGYVATGDIGYLDEDGYLYITGRIKDLIVLSTGKKVAPVPIEKSLEGMAVIERAVVFGSGKHYLTAVLQRKSSSVSTDEIKLAVTESGRNRVADERVHKYIVCDEPMSQENGLLTSQFKVKRDAIWERYGDELLALYESAN